MLMSFGKLNREKRKRNLNNMNLTNLPIGETAEILAINGNNEITRRLMEMGIVPGVAIRVIKSAPFGDPLEVRVRGYHLAMRKNEADTIEIRSPKSEVRS